MREAGFLTLVCDPSPALLKLPLNPLLGCTSCHSEPSLTLTQNIICYVFKENMLHDGRPAPPSRRGQCTAQGGLSCRIGSLLPLTTFGRPLNPVTPQLLVYRTRARPKELCELNGQGLRKARDELSSVSWCITLSAVPTSPPSLPPPGMRPDHTRIHQREGQASGLAVTKPALHVGASRSRSLCIPASRRTRSPEGSGDDSSERVVVAFGGRGPADGDSPADSQIKKI